jgi:hypothetical protein
MKAYNYMLSKPLDKEACEGSATGAKRHRWFPSGVVKALPGGNVSIDFLCKVCGKRHSQIVKQEQYDVWSNIIKQFEGE